MKEHDLIRENARLKKKIEALESEKADLEILMESGSEHGDFVIEDIIHELKTVKKDFLEKVKINVQEVADLHRQLEGLNNEKEDLEMMMEMATDHADGVGEELLDQIQVSEARFRLITETIPVPMLITRKPNGEILYANKPSAVLFGLSQESLLKKKGTDFYDSSERQRMLNIISEQGYMKTEELRGHSAGGTPFWIELSIQAMIFDGQDCLLSIWHDITHRKKAEDEILRLNQELARRERERFKNVIFILDGDQYGFDISLVNEIIRMQPLTPVPNTPKDFKGLINLRGRVFRVMDLRMKLGLKEAKYTERTCIIIVEIEKQNLTFGLIVDYVSEILSVTGREIRKVPSFGIQMNTDFIPGIIENKGKIIMLLDIEKLFSDQENV